VLLVRDTRTAQGLGEQQLDDLVESLRRRAPRDLETGGVRGGRGLRSTGEDLRLRQRVDELITDPPTLGRAEPRPHADAGVRYDIARRPDEQLLGHLAQRRVGGQRQRADDRAVHDGGAAAAQQLDLLFGATVGRYPDREAGKGRQGHRVTVPGAGFGRVASGWCVADWLLTSILIRPHVRGARCA
jgi:hypothetical protein